MEAPRWSSSYDARRYDVIQYRELGLGFEIEKVQGSRLLPTLVDLLAELLAELPTLDNFDSLSWFTSRQNGAV
jgi:hypothetical protein